MSVEGYTGVWGSGKTLMLAWEARRAQAEGRRVAATFHVDGAEFFDPALGIEPLMEFRDGLLLIDEINVVFPSRLWQTAPGTMLYFWAQGRKRGVEVRWTSQHERRVDTVIREVTHYVHHCRAIALFGRPRWVRTQTYFPGEGDASSEKARRSRRVRSRFHRIPKSLLSTFDTLELVTPAAHVVRVTGAGGTRDGHSVTRYGSQEARGQGAGTPQPARLLGRPTGALSGPPVAGRSRQRWGQDRQDRERADTREGSE